MPIDIDEFEEGGDAVYDEDPSEYEQVLEYLAFNPGKAYSREEIQSATGITGIDLIALLSRLESDGLVRHKGRYWAIAEGHERETPPAEDETT